MAPTPPRRPSSWRLLGWLFWLFSLSVQANPVLTGLNVEVLLQNGPPSSKIDLVFCGDGFLKSERKLLKSSTQALLQELWTISPYRDLKSHFNVYLVYLDAPQGGWDERGQRVGQYLLGSHKRPGDPSNLVRLQHPERVDAVVANAPACDIPVVMTRMEGRSHAGRHVVISHEHSLILAHEFGHRLAELGDEYTSASLLADRDHRPLPEGKDLPYVNLTTNAFIDPSTPASIRKTAKWKAMMELPDGDVLSAYQGGYYRVMDVWRPFPLCIMGSTQYNAFCPVCHEQLYRSILAKAGQPFDAELYRREFPLRNWKVRGPAAR